MQSKAVWLIRAAWISMGLIVVWAILSFAVFKPQNVSLLDLCIWGVLLSGNVILFIVGFVTSVIHWHGAWQTGDASAKRTWFRRILWSLPGLIVALLLVCLVIFLVISVFQAIVAVH